MAKILIVDDSGLSRRTLRRILESGGHTVIEAEDGIAGLEKYFLERPDLVLLDLMMAGMHGLDVLTKLVQMDPGACVVVATADIQHSTRMMAKGRGACAFINKPFEMEGVLDAVSSVLENRTSATSTE